jgi:hypothetical protein
MFVGAAAAQDPVIDEAAIAAEVAKLPLVEVERPWKEHAYPGFVESIDVLVGAGAHDCGYYDTHDRRQTPALHADVRRCVEDAMASGNPFKFGYEGLSVDALEWQVIARAPSAELWVVQIFRSIGNGDGRLQQINKVCASVKFFADIRTINHGCVEKSRGPLPAR